MIDQDSEVRKAKGDAFPSFIKIKLLKILYRAIYFCANKQGTFRTTDFTVTKLS